jgi:hypothetical protein
MCDYSLMHAKSRPAVVADKLVTKNFGMGTTGFCDHQDDSLAVCVLPGTEIAFSAPVETQDPGYFMVVNKKTIEHTTAIFRQINKDNERTHHDALEFPDGQVVLLTKLVESQNAVVLQLPAVPKNEIEAEDQRRVEVVA